MDNSAPTIWRPIELGDRGSIPVTVVKDHGDVLQVQNVASGSGAERFVAGSW